MSSVGFRSGDSWERSGYLFVSSPVGEDTLLIRTHIPVFAQGSAFRGSWRAFRKELPEESLGFTVCKRLWPASVLSICSSRTQRSTDGGEPTRLSHAGISLAVFANTSPGTSLCLSYPLVATPWMFPRDFDIVLQGGLATVFFKSSPDGFNRQMSREQWDTKVWKQDFHCCTPQK